MLRFIAAIILLVVSCQLHGQEENAHKQALEVIQEVKQLAQQDSVVTIEGLEEKITFLKNIESDTFRCSMLIELADVIKRMDAHHMQTAEIYDLAIKAGESSGNPEYLANAYLEAGTYQAQTGKIDKGLANYDLAYKLSSEHNYTFGLAQSHFGLGIIYRMLNDSINSSEHYNQAAKLYLELGDSITYSSVLNNMANAEMLYGNVEKSLALHNEILAIREVLNDEFGVAQSRGNMARIFMETGRFREALQQMGPVQDYFERVGDEYHLVVTYEILGKCQISLGNLRAGQDFIKKAEELASSIGADLLIKDLNMNVSLTYEQMGFFDKALEHYKRYIQVKNKIFGKETSANLAVMRAVHEKEKGDLQNEKLDLENARLREAEKRKDAEIERDEQQKKRLFIFIGILAVLVLVVLERFVVSQRRKKVIEAQKEDVETQKQLLEEKNQEITDSITYAKRIQAAILPSDTIVHEALPDPFVLYKPKDIVAGDFYWIEEADDQVLFAAADCTGHGVPGAMVSVVCHNALNRAVREYGLREPGEILDKTREMVTAEFEKSEENVRDGMDIALVSLSRNREQSTENRAGQTMVLKYAGAHNPLWILRGSEIIVTPANKEPIGRFSDASPFETHTVELQPDDTIFVFSDGFSDQFGGEKGKKFRASNFKSLLISLAGKPMPEQKQALNQAFETWRGDLEQVDDVCVIGVRV